jgi:hypothetical protein
MRWKSFALVGLCTIVSVGTAATILALDEAGFIRLVAVEENAPQEVALAVPEPQPVTPLAVPAPQPATPRAAPKTIERFTYASLDPAELVPSPYLREQDVTEEPEELDSPDLAEVPDEADDGADDVLNNNPPAELETTDSWHVDVKPEEREAQSAETPSRSAPQTQRATRPRGVYRTPALEKRLAQISPGATARLWKKFSSVKAAWPPSEIALVAIKDEKVIELFARQDENAEWQFVHRYPVLAASGGPGPKLRQGDKQVPEGVYRISLLNPNSRYHVSLRVNYPNEFDREKAKEDGRTNLGGDIMIHGKDKSAGCLAVGDEAAEELFVLAAHIGLDNIKLIIAPTDFRRRGIPPVSPHQPKWLPELYTQVAEAMTEFKSPPPRISLLSLFGI